tara:strand:+ start:268 stop:435 length:168 start_codon:yes stop_codon:yes gene_type:complete
MLAAKKIIKKRFLKKKKPNNDKKTIKTGKKNNLILSFKICSMLDFDKKNGHVAPK